MTLIQFFQPANQPFQFNATLDGQVYLGLVPWGLFGRRYYLRLSGLDGTLIFNKALVASPGAMAIEALTWVNGYVRVKTTLPHGYKVLDTVALTVTGCLPDLYNGRVRALITKRDEFIYPFADNLGAGTRFGLVSYDINLADGYFNMSTLIFREGSQQFEVTP